MAPVTRRTADVVDRCGGLGDQFTEPPHHRVGERGRRLHQPSSSEARNASASGAVSGAGPADPIPVPTRPGDSDRAKEHTAITIAFRGPTFENCCGPVASGTWIAVISSSTASTDCLGPVQNSAARTRRAPRTEDSSTDASEATSGGNESPAGEAEPRLPAIVPRLRICGEPTVRDAVASPGNRSASSVITRA